MYPSYQPASLVETILALVFYIIMAGFAIYSLMAIYALVRYGRSKLIALGIALLYLVVMAGLYAAAVENLNHIKF